MQTQPDVLRNTFQLTAIELLIGNPNGRAISIGF
jgi:hypothetical protein